MVRALGKGITAIIVDTHFIADNQELGDRLKVVPGTEIKASIDQPSMSAYEKEHGTQVASVMAGKNIGVAPEMKVIGVEAPLTRFGLGSKKEYEFYSGLFEWAVEERKKDPSIRIIGVSLGRISPVLEGEIISMRTAPHVQRYMQALGRANDAGITVVFAAGNEGRGGSYAYGRMGDVQILGPSIINVGAVDTGRTPLDTSDDQVAGFSSRSLSE